MLVVTVPVVVLIVVLVIEQAFNEFRHLILFNQAITVEVDLVIQSVKAVFAEYIALFKVRHEIFDELFDFVPL